MISPLVPKCLNFDSHHAIFAIIGLLEKYPRTYSSTEGEFLNTGTIPLSILIAGAENELKKAKASKDDIISFFILSK